MEMVSRKKAQLPIKKKPERTIPRRADAVNANRMNAMDNIR